MKMKKLLVGTVLLGLGVALVGCSAKEAKDDGKTTVRFSTWDSEKSLDMQQQLVDKFNDEHKDIKVVLEAYGSEYDTKISAGIGAKDAPDVMYMWNYPQYKDALEPLDSFIEKEGAEFKDDFYETLWSYNSVDGDILGLPVGFTTHAIYYNKDMFDAKKVEYPKAGWTWDELHQKAKTLSDSKTGDIGYALPGKPDPYDFEMFAWGNDASYSTDDGKLSGALDSEKSIQVFDDFQGMLKDESAIATEGDGSTEMESGKVGMFVTGSWSLEPLKDAGINYGLAEIPSRNGNEGVSIISSSGLAMSKYSKNKEAAFEFIKFWTNQEANNERIEYELPVLKSVVKENGLEEDEYKGIFYEMLIKSEGFTPSSFKVANWSDVSEDLKLSFEQIFNPSTMENPKTVLKSVTEKE